MMVETASRNLCETLAKVQEERQYRHQIQQLIDQRQQVEAKLAEAMSTQCKKIQKWDKTTRIDQEIWLPSEVERTLDPKRFSRMLRTDAMEPDKEYTEGAAQLKATNIAFLGIVPDVTHEWIATVIKEIGDIRRNEAQRGMATMPHSIAAEARADLKDGWQRIQTTMMTGAEMMQLAIEARMRQLKKEMERTYETSLVRVFRAKPPVHTNAGREQEILIMVERKRTRDFPCGGPVCKWKEANHGAAARRAPVPTAGTKCKRCKHTAKAFRLVDKVEETLQDNREMIRRLLNVELNAKQPFNISQICHKTLEKVSEDEGMRA